MGKLVTTAVLGAATVIVGLLGLVAVTAGALTSGATAGAEASRGASGIPPAWLTRYQQAASACPGLPWTVLAAIGTVESDNGTSTLPGVHSGANAAGAEGPMQFEPATFAAYDQPVPAGGADPPTPYDPTDAVYAAARMLCADGAATDLPAAVFDYDHSEAYVNEVLTLAQSYTGSGAGPVSGAGAAAVAWALAQVGTPYRWGGESPGIGFDCSGLVQAAYRAAGVTVPRVAQDQYDATARLGPGDPLEPGDLVFFGSGPGDVTHVGLVVTGGVMVDAPHTGADVREETFPTAIGAAFGSDVVVGFTRP